MTHAALSVIFKDAKQFPVLEYHGDQVTVNADGWVEAKVEFDYDRGIPKKMPAATPDAKAKLAEMVEAQRAGWPEYDVSPRADDGRNLALSVAKWEGRAGIPGEPFRVWAVGPVGRPPWPARVIGCNTPSNNVFPRRRRLRSSAKPAAVAHGTTRGLDQPVRAGRSAGPNLDLHPRRS